MQIVFKTNQHPYDYAEPDPHDDTAEGSKFCGVYPDAPSKCPFKDCGINIKMKKHGFYTRYLLTLIFAGKIKIRRYICEKCMHTVSMLPSFCLSQYIYGLDLIIELMSHALREKSISGTVKKFNKTFNCITIKQIKQYLNRLRRNRKLIQYGFNQISPGIIKNDDSPGDIEWTRRILTGKRPILTPESNADFHKATGKSFMSMHNKIAQSV